MSAYIEVNHVQKSFGRAEKQLQVLDDVDFTVDEGEFICIVGGSGCGKSTLLRAVAGIDSEHGGEVVIDAKKIERPSKEIGVVFQEPRLFPWLTAEQNIAYALDGAGKAEKKEKVSQNINLVGLSDFAESYPAQLSGGMAQRVSIARALVNRPKVLLLDEPFGALDAFTKIQMQNELLKIQRQEKTTMIMVTHDIEEAVYLSDRIIAMSAKPGRVKKIVHNELPRPRDRNSYEFTMIKKKIYEEFFHDAKLQPEYII